jgi:hypothetical protein
MFRDRRRQIGLGGCIVAMSAALGVACGSFGADAAPSTGDAGEAGSGPDPTAPDAASAPDAAASDAGCIDVLGDGVGLTTAYEIDGKITATPLETVTFDSRPPGGGNQEVRAHRALTMPAGATVVRLDADVEVSYPAWDGGSTTWSTDAYFPVMGILAGTQYGKDPQASLTIGQSGGGAINMFPTGSSAKQHPSTSTVSFEASGKRVTFSLWIDYGVARGLHATGSSLAVPFTTDLPGDVGQRPSGAFLVYVGGGAGGAIQPPVKLVFHKLCVAFTN